MGLLGQAVPRVLLTPVAGKGSKDSMERSGMVRDPGFH